MPRTFENYTCSTFRTSDTNLNKYEVNLDSIYTDIEIHDKMHIDGKDYEVIDKILHHNRLWALDNIQIFISILDDA